ncbi:MAG: XRE family transcriptional regulator [Gammaproteobacteria bacterium]|nr:MAG: XRE family transcriptional regulator [Gammaproteobacteria bacterium]
MKVQTLALKYKTMIRILLRDAIERYAEKTGERLTYAMLAERTGIARSTLESMGSRQGYNTSTRHVDLLCRVLGCTPCELLEYIPEPEKQGHTVSPDSEMKHNGHRT